MKRTILYPLLTLYLLIFSNGQAIASGNDSIRLSLLTCAPGEEIYSLFGHTAIRYEDPANGIDAVFNYGLFSFNTPNFILRFSLCLTDYQLGATDYARFAAEYAFDGRSVWQQTLNLSKEEKAELIRLLQENYLPENRVYRYNFFYDNCATRPRDKIEESIDGKVIYPAEPQDGSLSFRDIVHQYCKGHPWARFGIDLCIGSEADRPITQRQMMFAPFYLMDAFAGAQIVHDSVQRPLVSGKELIVDALPEEEEGGWMPTPFQCSLLLFILTAAAAIYSIRKRTGLWCRRHRGLCAGLPRPILRTSGCQLQFLIAGIPSGTASDPSIHHLLCPKRKEMLVFDAEFSRFNTFYGAFSANSAEI